jgi:hypothetical protein
VVPLLTDELQALRTREGWVALTGCARGRGKRTHAIWRWECFPRGLKQRRNESSGSRAADVWDVSELPGTVRMMAGSNASEAVFWE